MDGDELIVLFIGAAVCLVGLVSLFEEVEEGGIFHWIMVVPGRPMAFSFSL